jgi:hypothetical protein
MQMKAKSTNSLRCSFFKLVALVTCSFTTVFSSHLVGQSTIFSENMGSPSGNVSIASHVFQTSLAFSGTGDVRITGASNTYAGFSGSGNVLLNGVGETFEIATIVTTGFSTLNLSFGAFKSTIASSMSELTLEFSTDGSTYTTVPIPAQATGSGTAVWRLVTVALPVAAEEASNLRLRWTSSTASPEFRLDDVLLSGSPVSSPTHYFRSLTTGDWNTAGSWQSSPNNVSWYTATLVPTNAAALITVQSTHTISINAFVTGSTVIVEGSGKLTFDGVAARSLDLTGDLTISSSAGSFITQSSGTFTNRFYSTGNIINNGIFDMTQGGITKVCTVIFNKNGNQTITGTGATTRFGYMNINLGTSSANALEISSSNFSAVDGFLDSLSTTPGQGVNMANRLKNGTLKLSGSFTYVGCPFLVNGYNNTIVSTAGFWVNNPNVTITGFNDSYDLKGLFRLTTGTINIGVSLGNSLKYYTGSTIIIEGGTLTIGGRLCPNTVGQVGNITISGGTTTVVKYGSGTASSKFAGFQISSTSTFVWSEGTVILQQGQAYYGGMDYSDASTTATITGGTLQICSASTLSTDVNEFYFYSVNSIPNLTITSTITPTVYLFSNLTVLGSISIAAGATLDVQADPNAYAYELANSGSTVYGPTATYTISLKANWINNGTFAARDKTVTFNGISAQTLSGASSTIFYNLTMNNGSTTGLSFSSPASVSGGLTLLDGNIYTSNPNFLTLLSGSTSTPGTTASFVDGPMKKTGSGDFVFPLGDGSRWRRVAISALTGSETFTAQYFYAANSNTSMIKGEVNPLTWISNSEYWTLTRAGANDAAVELFWEDAAASTLPACTDLRIAHWDNANTYWEKANEDAVSTTGSCTGTSAGSIYSNAALVEFSPFTFGGVTIVALPISLVSFDAKLEERKVNLTWTTLSEQHNDFFTLEKTNDGVNFEFVAEVEGAGDHNGTLNYIFIDESPLKGISYYRLSQTDFDGHIESFEMRSINNESESLLSTSMFPNPVLTGEMLHFRLEGYGGEDMELSMTDLLGRKHLSEVLVINQKMNEFSIQIPPAMDAGIYTVNILRKGVLSSEKLVIR